MFRQYAITLPADTSAHSIWDSLITNSIIDNLGQVISGGNSTTEIVTDRVCDLRIQSKAGSNETITILARGQSTGLALAVTDLPFIMQSSRNTICIRDYFIKGSASSQAYVVSWESI